MARQVTQKEAADARKKKRTREVQRKQEKEREVTRRVKAGERRSDVESELMSDDPTDLDDMVFSDEEGSREVVVTSAERRDPTATSAGEEHESTWHAVVPAPRKRAASADAVGGRAAQWTWLPYPLAVSPVPSSPVADAVEQAGRSEE